MPRKAKATVPQTDNNEPDQPFQQPIGPNESEPTPQSNDSIDQKPIDRPASPDAVVHDHKFSGCDHEWRSYKTQSRRENDGSTYEKVLQVFCIHCLMIQDV